MTNEDQICMMCGRECEFVGKYNRFGIRKPLCCACYEKSYHKHTKNPNFNQDQYCTKCKKKLE
jgi:hypothetical protein